MSNVLVEENSLVVIANAIRSQNGGAATYTPGQMAQAILDLEIGAGGTLIEKTVTAEGTYTASADNADGYSKVINNIPWYILPYVYDWNPNAYVMNSNLQYNGSTVNYSDVYKLKNGHKYYLVLGDRTGTRYRGGYFELNPDPTLVTDTTTKLSAISMPLNYTNPAARFTATLTAPKDCYFIITKDNAGKSGIKTYLFDITKS